MGFKWDMIKLLALLKIAVLLQRNTHTLNKSVGTYRENRENPIRTNNFKHSATKIHPNATKLTQKVE